MTLDIETLRDDLPVGVTVTALPTGGWNLRREPADDCDQWQVALLPDMEPDAALALVWDTHEHAIYRAQQQAAKAARDAEQAARDEAYKRDIHAKRLQMQSRKEAKRQAMKDKHGKKDKEPDNGTPA